MESGSAGRGREEVVASSSGSCVQYVGAGAAVGAVFGLAAGACHGTFEAFFINKVPGLLKIRYIGRSTLLGAAAFGIFVGSGCLIDCGNINRRH